ncbi:unnamed protein product, partial [Amoebophrya sp. A120]|eukprot:GSA120T00009606001.1
MSSSSGSDCDINMIEDWKMSNITGPCEEEKFEKTSNTPLKPTYDQTSDSEKDVQAAFAQKMNQILAKKNPNGTTTPPGLANKS